MFDKKGVFLRCKANAGLEEQLLEAGLEGGVEDVLDDDDSAGAVRGGGPDRPRRIEAAGISFLSAELNRIPQNTGRGDAETGRKCPQTL